MEQFIENRDGTGRKRYTRAKNTDPSKHNLNKILIEHEGKQGTRTL